MKHLGQHAGSIFTYAKTLAFLELQQKIIEGVINLRFIP